MSTNSRYKRRNHDIGETQPSSACSTAQISSIITHDRKKTWSLLLVNVQAHFQHRSFLQLNRGRAPHRTCDLQTKRGHPQEIGLLFTMQNINTCRVWVVWPRIKRRMYCTQDNIWRLGLSRLGYRRFHEGDQAQPWRLSK